MTYEELNDTLWLFVVEYTRLPRAASIDFINRILEHYGVGYIELFGEGSNGLCLYKYNLHDIDWSEFYTGLYKMRECIRKYNISIADYRKLVTTLNVIDYRPIYYH